MLLSGEFEDALFAGFAAKQLGAERRFRCDHQDFTFVANDLGAAGARTDEIDGGFLAGTEFDQGARVNGVSIGEVAHGELFEIRDGFGDLGGVTRLAPGKVGCFEAAGVILVLGFALFIGRLGAGGIGSFVIKRQVRAQFFEDGFQ